MEIQPLHKIKLESGGIYLGYNIDGDEDIYHYCFMYDDCVTWYDSNLNGCNQPLAAVQINHFCANAENAIREEIEYLTIEANKGE